MLNIRRNLAVFLTSGAVSFAAILVAAWPYETQADDPQAAAAAQEDIGLDTSKIGVLEAKSHLVKDPGPQNKWYLEVEVKNPGTEGPEAGTYDVDLRKVAFSPSMGRSGPVPTVAFSHTEQVRVPAGETLVKRYPLSPALCFQISNSLRQAKAAETGSGPGPRTSFFTSIETSRPRTAGPQGSNNRAKLQAKQNAPLANQLDLL